MRGICEEAKSSMDAKGGRAYNQSTLTGNCCELSLRSLPHHIPTPEET